jgi:hypothetical protein
VVYNLTLSVAGGIWQPDARELVALRRDIDRRPNRIRRALGDAGIRRDYLEGASNEKKAVENFCERNKESALKTKPKVGESFCFLFLPSEDFVSSSPFVSTISVFFSIGWYLYMSTIPFSVRGR